MKPNLISFAASVVLALLAAGCASTPMMQSVEATIEARAQRVLQDLFPERALLTHKVSVRVARLDLILTGYLILDRQKGFRAVAIDEYGGKAFAFSACGDTVSVGHSPPQIEPDLLKRGPVRDLELLYCATAAQPEIGRRPDGVVTATIGYRGLVLNCDFDKTVQRVLSCSEGSGGRHGRSMILKYKDADAVPDRVEIRNRGLHYTMTADLLDSRGIADQVPCDDEG